MKACPSQILAGSLMFGALALTWPVLGPVLAVGGLAQRAHRRLAVST